MMKEIMEQPEALKKTIQPRVTESGIHLEDVSLTEEEIKTGTIHVVALRQCCMPQGLSADMSLKKPAVSPLRWISHPNSDTETLSLRKMTSASSSMRQTTRYPCSTAQSKRSRRRKVL